jgi:nicotinamidase/pyrazinamidase
MLPGGKLNVPGAERLLPNIRKLTDTARQGHVFLVSHGCYHGKDDPDFQTFPPHCIKGTTGAEFVREAAGASPDNSERTHSTTAP